MDLLLFLPILAIGLGALATLRIGRSDHYLRSRQLFFFTSILIVAIATMTMSALADPMWLAYAGLFSLMLIGGVIDFSIGSQQPDFI